MSLVLLKQHYSSNKRKRRVFTISFENLAMLITGTSSGVGATCAVYFEKKMLNLHWSEEIWDNFKNLLNVYKKKMSKVLFWPIFQLMQM